MASCRPVDSVDGSQPTFSSGRGDWPGATPMRGACSPTKRRAPRLCPRCEWGRGMNEPQCTSVKQDQFAGGVHHGNLRFRQAHPGSLQMTHGARQRARTCAYIRRGPDSGEKKGVFVGNHGNFQKRRKMTTKGARLEGRESEPAAQVGKRLFQAPSDRGETRRLRAPRQPPGPRGAAPRGLRKRRRGKRDRGRVGRGLRPPGVDGPLHQDRGPRGGGAGAPSAKRVDSRSRFYFVFLSHHVPKRFGSRSELRCSQPRSVLRAEEAAGR